MWCLTLLTVRFYQPIKAVFWFWVLKPAVLILYKVQPESVQMFLQHISRALHVLHYLSPDQKTPLPPCLNLYTACSQHTDNSKNAKAWSVSQHTDTSKNTKAWCVSQHINASEKPSLGCHSTLTPVKTPRLGLHYNTMTPARTPRLSLCHSILTPAKILISPGCHSTFNTSKNTKAWAVSQHQQKHQGLGCLTTQ